MKKKRSSEHDGTRFSRFGTAGMAVMFIVATVLCGCTGTYAGTHEFWWFGDSELSKARPSDNLLYHGKLHLRNGDYGLAEKYFRLAVEENDTSLDAWLGLAASYDRIGRFDLAERAYDVLVKQVGYTTTVLNNLGYHHMLRGNLDKARRYLEDAAQKDPGNPHVQHNLQLLETWPTSPGALYPREAPPLGSRPLP